MLFNSFHFLVFFPVVVTIYFIMPYKYRWVVLLLSSYYFYMAWEPAYLILILISTVIDYFAGIMMDRVPDKKRRLKYLLLSLTANLGLLFLFKYFNFFNLSFGAAFEYFGLPYTVPESTLLLPVGISFYTFQTLSYTIEVYRGKQETEYHLGRFALYVAFFPQLVAGPIERAGNLLPQLSKKFDFDYYRVTDGLKLIAWGMFKKVVIADRLAILVNIVYNDPFSYEGISLIVATVLFAFQIFCDFSGYSDIAIGAARVMGIKLMLNFDRPYFSKSISEFWKRWHISLSSWFKDYLYISLGGNRVPVPRWYFNLFIVFLVSGLWHGANWTFVIWGALHGIYLITSILTAKLRGKIVKQVGLNESPLLHKYLKVLVTFSLVCFSWIFFRANNLSDAFYMVTHLFSGWNVLFESPALWSAITLGMPKTFIISVVFISMMEMIHLLQRHGSVRQMISELPVWQRWPLYYITVLIILAFGVYDNTPFIYFQF